MATTLTQEDARAVARILYAVHQRRAAREAAERDLELEAGQAHLVVEPRVAGGQR